MPWDSSATGSVPKRRDSAWKEIEVNELWSPRLGNEDVIMEIDSSASAAPAATWLSPSKFPIKKNNMEKLQELFQATNFRHSFVTWKQTTKTEICGVRTGSESRPEGAQGDLLVEPGLTEDVVIGSWKKDPRYVKLSVKTVTCSNMESTKSGPGYRVFQHKCWQYQLVSFSLDNNVWIEIN